MAAKVTTGLGLTVLGLAALVWLAGSRPAAAPEPADSRAGDGSGGAVRGTEMTGTRGVAIQIQSSYAPQESFGPLIREVAELGANTVLLSTAGFMEHARAQALYIDALKTPCPEDLKSLIRQARQLGLRVILMPIVLLSHPRGSEWRGVIDPPDWETWWRDYREFILYFADIARQGGATALMVGSELVGTEKHTPEWVKTIELVRQRFPDGQLGYSANWDHYKPIRFWDKLDFIGMTSYYTLADRKNPSVDQIVSRWRPIHEEITQWRRTVGKPLLLTEVGWCSQEGAAMAPWNYYQNTTASPAGHEEQRRLYEAFLRVWDATPGLAGVIWWEWTAGGGPDDHGYTPRHKPAEQVLRRWFEDGRPRAKVLSLPSSP